MELGDAMTTPEFWLAVLGVSVFLGAQYFLMREAVAGGMEEFEKRKEEKRRRGQR